MKILINNKLVLSTFFDGFHFYDALNSKTKQETLHVTTIAMTTYYSFSYNLTLRAENFAEFIFAIYDVCRQIKFREFYKKKLHRENKFNVEKFKRGVAEI